MSFLNTVKFDKSADRRDRAVQIRYSTFKLDTSGKAVKLVSSRELIDRSTVLCGFSDLESSSNDY